MITRGTATMELLIAKVNFRKLIQQFSPVMYNFYFIET